MKMTHFHMHCHNKRSFFGSSIFIGGEESIWSEIQILFLDSPKKTAPLSTYKTWPCPLSPPRPPPLPRFPKLPPLLTRERKPVLKYSGWMETRSKVLTFSYYKKHMVAFKKRLHKNLKVYTCKLRCVVNRLGALLRHTCTKVRKAYCASHAGDDFARGAIGRS